MKTRKFITCICTLFAALVFAPFSYAQATGAAKSDKTNVALKDYGPKAVVLDIESLTVANENFVRALWTGHKLQVTLMSIPVGGDIGLETHPDSDQFLRIEKGQGRVFMGDTRDSLYFEADAGPDFAIFIPAGKWHNTVNTGSEPLKLYSIYAPAEHAHGTVYKTQQEAEANDPK